VKRVPPGALGTGFSPKLHLDEIAPAPQTMFIDADCMVIGPLAPIFDRFAGRAVSVFGVHMSEGLYDAWGLARLRRFPNDEVLMSIAMAEANLEAVHDDGTIMVPYNSYSVFREFDVFAGRCAMENPPSGSKLHGKDVPVRVVHPVIPHFVDTYTHHWRYLVQAERLQLQMATGMPRCTFAAISIPGWIKMNGKERLRPLYRIVFGACAVKANERV
jgi:hypothetical protein